MHKSMKGAWMEDLSWLEAAARLKDGSVVVVPIGAVAKEHGHHLPLKTDYLVARELASRVADVLPVLVAPVIGFGFYPAFAAYPCSQHLRAQTFIALLIDVLGKLIADGARRVVIINTGVSTEAPLQLAVREILETTGVRVSVADIRQLGAAVRRGSEQKLGGHGDEWETSCILAIDPDSVRMELAVVDYGHMVDQPKTAFHFPVRFSGDPDAGPDYSITGVRGDPTLATREKGEALIAEMARELIAGIRALHPDAAG